MNADNILLEVKNLKKYFPVRKGILKRVVAHVHAVDGVDIHIKDGETLGLVGESGCGKTTTGWAILRMIKPTAGEIIFRKKNNTGAGKEYKAVDVARASRREIKSLRRDMLRPLHFLR